MKSYLGEPFKNDLFVSYSHGTITGRSESNLRTWSQALVRALEIELRSDPPFKDLRIFLDQDHRLEQSIDPMAPLSEQLRSEIDLAGILIVLMSPHYLLSDWCGKELAWWTECQTRNPIGAEGRLAIARIWPTEGSWPDALLNGRGEPLMTGFEFYDDTRPQPFGWPDVIEGDRPFRGAVTKMVGVLWHNLRKLKKQLEERHGRLEAADKLAADAGQIVYLHARPTHASQFEQVGLALEEHGFVVLPAEPDPVERDPEKVREIASLRIETLSGCDGLFLLATEDRRALQADLVVIGRQERQRARERSDRLLPCAVLDTAIGDASGSKHQRTARQLGISWFDADDHPWQQDVRHFLQQSAGRARE